MNDVPQDVDDNIDLSEQPPPEEDQGGGGFKETLVRWKERLKGILKIVGMFVGGLFLLAMGIGLNHGSFGQIEEMRQLERTPEISPSAVVTGEVLVSGRATEAGNTVRAPDTGTETLYYKYVIEEHDDDDGWETVREDWEAVDFVLAQDGSGVHVRAGAGAEDVEFEADQRNQRRSGDRRFTEYRIDPGDEAFVFGYAEEAGDGYEIGFEPKGSYEPLISTASEDEHRHGLTIKSGLLVVFGITALLFGVFLLLRVFRVHQTALYLVVATLVVVVSLGYQGFSMMVSDLKQGREAAARTVAEGQEVIEESLDANGVDWNGSFEQLGAFDESDYQELSEDERRRLAGVRRTMARSVHRLNESLARFPEVVVGPLVGVRPIEELPVPDETSRRIAEVEADHEPIRLGLPYGIGAIVLGLIATLWVTRSGIEKIGVKRTMEDVPTRPTSGAVYGLTELKGTAEAAGDGTLESPMTYSDCVYYRYVVKKKVKRDDKTKWKTVKDVSDKRPFFCRDETGRMRVEPDGAELSADRKEYRRSGRYRYYEWTIRPGDDVYVLGSATIDPETHQDLVIEEGDDDTPFLVSSLSESELMQRKASTGFAILNVGIAATVMAGMGVAGMAVSFSPMLYWVMALISCGYLFVVLAVLYYNDLIFLRDRVERAWSNIDVALKKRFDLVDNLAEVVQEYLDHEEELQESVARARSATRNGGEESKRQELEAGQRARNQVVARVEEYPELQGDELVEDLMETLREVEDEIALMRDGYNDAVERYNNRIRHIPEIAVAWLANFERADFLHDR